MIRFCYHTRYSKVGQPAENTREANPYGLTYMNGWYLVAYCHLRQGLRTFRLDRMTDVEFLPTSFQRPSDFRMQEHQPDEEPRNLTVRAIFASEIAQWVRETRPYHTVAEEEGPYGLLMTFKVRHENEIVQWLLSWGRHVQVLEPVSLRQRLADEATAMLQQHTGIG
jgi:predicted DNA-binding transcriptional regulator YafY